MTGEKIYPDWVKSSDRVATEEDTNNQGELFYFLDNYPRAFVFNYIFGGTLDSSVESYWAKCPDSAGENYAPEDIATPKECYSKKLKDLTQGQKEINEADKDCKEILDDKVVICRRCGVDMAGSHSPKAVNGFCLHCCTAFKEECNKILSNCSVIENESDKDNPWIKGNTPEDAGTYQVTLDRGYVDYSEYSTGKKGGWEDFKRSEVIAYKKPIYSDPYDPSERELRCPFCDNNEAVIDGNNFLCGACGASLPWKTKEQIFELYDKLKGD